MSNIFFNHLSSSVFEGTLFSEHLGELNTDLLLMFVAQILLVLPVILQTLDVEMRILCTSYHHLWDSLFFMLKVTLNDIGCVFRLVVLLQNTSVADKTPPGSSDMNKYLLVFLNTENSIYPDHMTSVVCRNATSTLQGTSTVFGSKGAGGAAVRGRACPNT